MDKYEYNLRNEEINTLIGRREFQKAVAIADTIDWTKVRSVKTLCKISDLYKVNRRYKESRILLEQALMRYPNGKNIVSSLCDLCIRMNDVVGATEYYKQFVQMAPTDNMKFILLYKMYEAQEATLDERIEVLEGLKKRERIEKWCYELALLYHRTGLTSKCVEECDDLILWFREGKYVKKAMELKMLHQQLTGPQDVLYINMLSPEERAEYIDRTASHAAIEDRVEEEPEEILVKTVDVGQYSTINIQKALEESIKGTLSETSPYSTGNIYSNYGTGSIEQGDDITRVMPSRDSEINYELEANIRQSTGSLSVKHSDEYEQPVEQYTQEYPQQVYEQEQPVEQYIQEYPQQVYEQEQPVEQYTQEYPQQVYEQEQPAEQYTQEYSEPVYEQEQPVEQYTQEYPQQVYEQGQPAAEPTVGEESKRLSLQDTGEMQELFFNDSIAEAPVTEIQNEEPEIAIVEPVALEPELTESEVTDEEPVEPAVNISVEEPGQTFEANELESRPVFDASVVEEAEAPKEVEAPKEAEVLQEDVASQVVFPNIPVSGDTIVYNKGDIVNQVATAMLGDKSTPEAPVAASNNTLVNASKEELMELIDKKVAEALENAMKGQSMTANVAPRRDSISHDAPPRSMQKMLSQEYNGQISLVVPEQEMVEKQITGQINLDEYLTSWEDTKQQNKQKYEAELKNQLMRQTGNLFTDFEVEARDNILAKIDENKEQGIATPIDADKEYEEYLKRILAESEKEDIPNNEAPVTEVEAPIAEETPVEEPSVMVAPVSDVLPVTADDTDEVEELEEIEDNVEIPEETPVTESADDIIANGEVEAAEPVSAPVTAEFIVPVTEEVAEPEETAQEEPIDETAESEAIAESEEMDDDSEIPSEEAVVIEPEESIEEETETEPVAVNEEPIENEAETEPVAVNEEPTEAEVETVPVEANEASNENDSAESVEEPAETTSEPVEENIREMTEDEIALFAQFFQTKKAKQNLIKALDNISLASCTGNVFVSGEMGEEPVELAKNVVQYAKVTDGNFSGKIGKVTGMSLNGKDLAVTVGKMSNGGLIIERAGDMREETVQALLKVLNQDNLGVLVVMQDTKLEMNKMYNTYPEMSQVFNVQIEIEELSDDALVAFGRKYAERMEYSIDEMGILALHTRIDEMQTCDHVVTVADVRDIIDDAIENATRFSPKHITDVIFGKRYDDDDMIILKERDFIN